MSDKQESENEEQISEEAVQETPAVEEEVDPGEEESEWEDCVEVWLVELEFAMVETIRAY